MFEFQLMSLYRSGARPWADVRIRNIGNEPAIDVRSMFRFKCGTPPKNGSDWNFPRQLNLVSDQIQPTTAGDGPPIHREVGNPLSARDLNILRSNGPIYVWGIVRYTDRIHTTTLTPFTFCKVAPGVDFLRRTPSPPGEYNGGNEYAYGGPYEDCTIPPSVR
jgi:hypothetical protein